MMEVRRAVSLLSGHLWLVVFACLALLPTSTLYNIPLLFLSLLGMMAAWQGRKVVFTDVRIKQYAVLFLCIWIPMVISLPDAVNFSRSFTTTLGFFLYFFMGVSVILYFPAARRSALFIACTGVLILLWCLDAAWQAYSGADVLGYPHRGQLTGMFYPSVKLGLVLALLSPFYFEFIRIGCRTSRLMFLLLVPFLYIVVLAGNKNAWVLLSISFLLYLLFLYLNRSLSLAREYLVMMAAAVLLGLLALGSVHKLARPEILAVTEERLVSVLALAAGDVDRAGASFAQRIKIWEGSLRVIRDHWFNGVGPRGFRYIVEHYTAPDVEPVWTARAKKSTHPHQYVLEIFAETGIVGITGYVIFLALVIRLAVRTITEKYYQKIPWLIPMLLITFPLSSHKAFYGSYLAALLWMMIAVALSVTGSGRASGK